MSLIKDKKSFTTQGHRKSVINGYIFPTAGNKNLIFIIKATKRLPMIQNYHTETRNTPPPAKPHLKLMITGGQINYCTDNTAPLTLELSEERQPTHRPHRCTFSWPVSKSRRLVSDWLKGICHPAYATASDSSSVIWNVDAGVHCVFSTRNFLLNSSRRRVLNLKKEHGSGTVLQTWRDLEGGMLLNVPQSRIAGWQQFSPMEPLWRNLCVYQGLKHSAFSRLVRSN